MKTPTTSARRALIIAAGVALVALPAAAAVQTQVTAPTPAGATVVVDATVSAAPAPDGATAVAAAPADPAPAAAAATTTVNDELAASAPAASSTSPNAALAAAADESGSTEAKTVQRRCDAKDDPHYHPSSGRDSSQCFAGGTFQPTKSYTATHYTNEVDCGEKNLQGGVGVVGLWIFGSAGASGGYASVCSDDTLPIHGRGTARGGTGGASATIDGDKTNPEQTTQGWITVSATPAGPSYRCGKSYAEGGRGTADAPTAQDTAAECG